MSDNSFEQPAPPYPPNIRPPTSGRPNIPVKRSELPASKLSSLDRDEKGQPCAKPSQYLPHFTFKEEKERLATRKRDYKSAIPVKNVYRCSVCDDTLEGRIKFKHHLREVHRWGNVRIREQFGQTPKIHSCPQCPKKFTHLRHLNQHGRLRHGLKPKTLRCLIRKSQSPAPIPDAPRKSEFSPEVSIILRRNGLRPENIELDHPLSSSVLDVLKRGGSNATIHSECIKPPSHRSIKRAPSAVEPSESDYKAAMNSAGLSLLIPDDAERNCFLLYSVMMKSMQDIAAEVFGSEDKKPRVQKIISRVRNSLMKYLQRTRRDSKLRDDPSVAQLRALLCGNASKDSFDLEIENYPTYSHTLEEHLEAFQSELNAPPDDE